MRNLRLRTVVECSFVPRRQLSPRNIFLKHSSVTCHNIGIHTCTHKFSLGAAVGLEILRNSYSTSEQTTASYSLAFDLV